MKENEFIKTMKEAEETLRKENEEGGYFKEIREGKMILIGDLHGNFKNLEKIMTKTGFVKRAKKEKISILFLGDYVDRGQSSAEVFNFVLGLKLKFPKKVILLRGNHETEEMNDYYGFKDELRRKFKNWNEVYFWCKKIYRMLPYCTKTANGIFMVHGGIPIVEVDERNLRNPSEEIAGQLIWNDPGERDGFNFTRGGYCFFGKETAKNFLKKLKCKFLIRGHQVAAGYSPFFDFGLTLFSANVPVYLEIDANEKIDMKKLISKIKF